MGFYHAKRQYQVALRKRRRAKFEKRVRELQMFLMFLALLTISFIREMIQNYRFRMETLSWVGVGVCATTLLTKVCDPEVTTAYVFAGLVFLMAAVSDNWFED